MIAPVVHRFQWGQRVRTTAELRNDDGSFPELAEGALIIRAGDVGEVVQLGIHTDSNSAVYMVEFHQRVVVGCLEHELSPDDVPAPAAAALGATP
jgi:nitrogen fixation protein NifZ